MHNKVDLTTPYQLQCTRLIIPTYRRKGEEAYLHLHPIHVKHKHNNIIVPLYYFKVTLYRVYTSISKSGLNSMIALSIGMFPATDAQ